jgi:hypothetical protein
MACILAVYFLKNSESAVQAVFPNRLREPKPTSEHKMYGFALVEDQFVEKVGGLDLDKPSSKESGDLRRFCKKWLRISMN